MKLIINIVILLFVATILSCVSDDADPIDTEEALKYVIINDSENIIDKIYFHYTYGDYKNESNSIGITSLKRGDTIKVCPIGNQYITFRRELSKTDPDTKIYVTSSIPLNYKKGIITIKLGDSDFYVTTEHNPRKICECNSRNCITDLDDCKNNPCLNDGICQNTSSSYVCSCQSGYEGDNCEIKIDYCKNNSCQNNGVCKETNYGYICECLDGYYGHYCEAEDICILANPCIEKNTISCQKDNITNYRCECKVGYEGINCEKSIDFCQKNDCYNGNCINGEESYSCECFDGYRGEFCNECEEGVNCVINSIFQFGTEESDKGLSVVTDNFDNIYVMGNKNNNMFLSKFNEFNIVEWRLSNINYSKLLAIDNDNNLYIVGKDIISGHIFLARLDNNGVTRWTKEWGVDNTNVDKIITDNRGNIYIIGTSINDATKSMFLLKYSFTGELIWSKQQINENRSYDKLSVLLDNNENIYISGYLSNPNTFFITKFNTNMEEEWIKEWETDKSIKNPLAIDNLNNLYIIRYSNEQLFMIKLDNNATEIWNKELDNSEINLYSILINNDNIYTLGGSFYNLDENINQGSEDIVLIKYNNEGVKQSSKTWGSFGLDKANDFVIDNNYIYITGYTDNRLGSQNYGNTDAFLIKTTIW